MLGAFRSWLRRPGPAIGRDPIGFTVHRRSRADDARRVPWAEVAAVVAFKRDLGVVDRIGLAISLRDGTAIELHEEMAGWDALVKVLEADLPGARPWASWFLEVAFPAFAPNQTIIYAADLAGPTIGPPG